MSEATHDEQAAADALRDALRAAFVECAIACGIVPPQTAGLTRESPVPDK